MTAAKAKGLAGDLLQQGLSVTITPRAGGEFQVTARSAGTMVDLALLAPLLTTYTVSAPVTEVTFL